MRPRPFSLSLALFALLGGVGGAALACEPVARADVVAADALQVRAKLVLVGDGTRIENGVVVISDGKIVRVGPGELDPNLPSIDHDGVLTAGIVAGHSFYGTRGTTYDSARSVLPEARMAYAVRAESSDFEKARREGLTTVVVAPSGQNLAGGKTCVLKTSGEILKKDGHLALSLSKEALSQGSQEFVFFFSADAREAAVDDGLEQSGGPQDGTRYPTSYSGALEALGELLSDREGVFEAVASGRMPVLIEAWDRNEVARAAAFAKEHGLKGAVRGAPLAGELASALKESGLGVVLGPFDAGQSRRSLDGLPALVAAGVPFAFSAGGSGSDPSYARLSAAMAVGAGVAPDAAWKALTSDAAALAGVGDRVGRVASGLDADLVLWSGHPLDLASKVESVFIDGKLVYGGAQ